MFVALVTSAIFSRAACTCGSCDAHGPCESYTFSSTLLHWLTHPATTVLVALTIAIVIHAEIEKALIGQLAKVLEHAPVLLDEKRLGGIDAELHRSAASITNSTNNEIRASQDVLNRAVFGWVNGTAPSAESTLNAVLDAMTGTVRDILGHTPVDKPAEAFVNCVIGSKISAAERMLQWIQENLRITLPLVDENLIMHPFRSAELLPERALAVLRQSDIYAGVRDSLFTRTMSLQQREWTAFGLALAYLCVLIAGALWYKLAR